MTSAFSRSNLLHLRVSLINIFGFLDLLFLVRINGTDRRGTFRHKDGGPRNECLLAKKLREHYTSQVRLILSHTPLL